MVDDRKAGDQVSGASKDHIADGGRGGRGSDGPDSGRSESGFDSRGSVSEGVVGMSSTLEIVVGGDLVDFASGPNGLYICVMEGGNHCIIDVPKTEMRRIAAWFAVVCPP